jgi:hypothetical protein
VSTSFEYVAHFEERGASRAARAFFIRSVVKLRLWNTVFPPVVLGLMTLLLYHIAGDSWSLGVVSTFFLLSLLHPVIFFFARPVAAARFAQKNPEQIVRIGENGVTLRNQNGEATIAWKRFKHVWDAEGYVLLVVTPFSSLNLPKQGMPEGAQQFIVQSIASANAA